MPDLRETDPKLKLEAGLAGRYRLEQQIGQGGMATVYLAHDIKHDRSVALKLLRPELAVSVGIDRFLREIKVAARLQHPNILALYDSGETDGLLFYVMPFVEGESLRDRIQREKQLALGDALRIARETAEALGHAHAHGVVHRDIKPENIMLMGGHALVADFGIARALAEAGDEKLTQSGVALGTPMYMSPEQAKGGSDVDGRSDIYSLGCVLYEMLTGQAPFDGPSLAAILARHSLEAVPSVRIVRDTVPEVIDEAIHIAMAKVAADRFQTAEELAETLSSVEATTTGGRISPRISSPMPGSVPATAPSAERRWWMVAAVAALVVIIAGTIWQVGVRAGAGTVGSDGLDPRNIAVLYFDDLSRDGSLGYLADGFTESLIGELSGVPDLNVISRNGVLPYQGAAVSPDSIGRALNVGTLVQGSVAGLGDQLRIRVAIVNAGNGRELAGTTLERPRQETFELQDDVAREVAVFLRRRLGQEVAVRHIRSKTDNVEAWTLALEAQRVLRGVDPLVATGDTRAANRELDRADSLYAVAASVDGNWVTPVTERARIAYRRTRLASAFDRTFFSEWLDRGMEHAERAVAIDPVDADARELRATLRYWRWLLNLAETSAEAESLFVAAERDFRASVAANPNQASAWSSLSHLLMNKSETAEAKLAALRAYEADPYLTNAHLTVWRLFQSSIDLEDQIEARRWCNEGQRRFAEDARFIECQLWLFALKGQTPDIPTAWALLDAYVAQSEPNIREFRRLRGQQLVAMALVRAELPDSARVVALRSRADATADPTRELAYLEAIVRTFLGENDEALRLLSTFLAANPQQRESMGQDQLWWFQDLRADPRYQLLVGNS